jgi:hypothetical protein
MTSVVNIQWTAVGAGSPTDITNIVDWNSVDVISVITKERGTFTFQILSTHWATALPSFGDVITIADSSGVIFGGTVTEVEKTVRKQQGGVLLQAQITVTDYGFLLDSKLVKTSYSQMDPADILADLVNTYGPGGFDVTSYVQRGGFLVSSISFNYELLSQCIQSLAQQISWDWYVDSNKAVHFFFAATEDGSSEYDPAPITIDDTGAGLWWGSLDIDVSITNMQNAIYVIGGTTAQQFVDSPVAGANPPEYSPKDVYLTDGVRFIFPLQYRYDYSTMSVFLNGVGNSIGIDLQNNPADYQVMYNTAGPFLIFPSPPTAGQTLKVEGVAQVPIVAFKRNDTSVADYGTREAAITDSQITTVQEAQAVADANILLYGHPVYDVKFTTTTPGLRIGQTILLNSTLFGVSSYPLIIKRIEATPFTKTALTYQVEAIGSDSVTFVDMIKGLEAQASNNNPVDSSTIIEAFQFAGEEQLTIHDAASASGATHNPFKWASTTSPSNWGFAIWQ